MQVLWHEMGKTFCVYTVAAELKQLTTYWKIQLDWTNSNSVLTRI